jgi:hypothetical protein
MNLTAGKMDYNLNTESDTISLTAGKIDYNLTG